eukprot:1193321-Amphidinium_carterae.1
MDHQLQKPQDQEATHHPASRGRQHDGRSITTSSIQSAQPNATDHQHLIIEGTSEELNLHQQAKVDRRLCMGQHPRCRPVGPREHQAYKEHQQIQ